MDSLDFFLSIMVRAVVAALPLILASQGQILTERSGILNLGVEGMMALGAFGAYFGTLTGGPVFGMVLAMILASSLGLIHAGISIGLRANQTVSGLAIAMLGTGLSSLLGKPFIGQTVAFVVPAWVYMIIALFLTVLVAFMLNHTRIGLKLRICGENPIAAESNGTNVALVRTLATVCGAGLIGLAGSFVSLSYQSSWIEGMINGRGWLVVALAIFALWKPLRSMISSFLFAMVFVLQYILQPLGIPSNLLSMLPYVGTLLFMIAYGIMNDQRKMSAPAALGNAYRRGER